MFRTGIPSLGILGPNVQALQLNTHQMGNYASPHLTK